MKNKNINSVIVLQARTSSSRLPGKAMLPISGIPMVVLAAKRAANTGRNIIVATSNDSSDDALAALLESYGLDYFRGSLENSLGRIVNSLLEFDDNTIVFRLTADNVFPDGALIDEIEEEFIVKNHGYLFCNGVPSGLPYGVSIEVTRLAGLREADKTTTDVLDRENVTPYVKRKYGEVFFNKYKNINMGHYRCTVDCLDDYLNVLNVFSKVSDPVNESSLTLVQHLKGIPLQPMSNVPLSKLVLGTAQFGGKYGIANITGQPTAIQCQELIKTAITNGVMFVDTARGYGCSEKIIGEALKSGWVGRAKIITKLSPLDECSEDMASAILHAFVDASIYKSCTLLRVQKLDVLMLHRASHMFDWNGEVWKRLLDLKHEGVIGELGVSVQSPEELVNILKCEEVKYIQMPFNLLDWRWDSVIPLIEEVKEKRDIKIHVRSGLLQGLIPSSDENLWLRANVENPTLIKTWLSEYTIKFNRSSVVDLCIAYLNKIEWIDGIVIGMEAMSQLAENIHYFNQHGLSQDQVDEIQRVRPKMIDSSLNPAFWIN